MYLQSETIVLNPKRERQGPTGRASWYPYYASFSQSFARCLIASINLSPKSRIMDPWNGSGTTIAAATSEGHLGFGFDINPVMVIAARARLLGRASKESIQPLVSEICIREKSINCRPIKCIPKINPATPPSPCAQTPPPHPPALRSTYRCGAPLLPRSLAPASCPP